MKLPTGGFLSRRGLLLVAAGGFASGLVTRQAIDVLTPAPRLLPRGIPMAGPVLPMEEEPLPSGVHLAAAQITQPIPAITEEPAQLSARVAVPETPSADPVVPPPVPVAQSEPEVKPASPKPAPPAKPVSSPVAEAAWLRNARPYIDTKNLPAVAIVIDDLGLAVEQSKRVMALDGAVTTALMTYAPGLENWTGLARAGGHEILVHVPMQPLNGKIDPGPRALTVGLTENEILDRLRWGLARLDGYIGINNHMGSRFTQDRTGMSVVMGEVKSRGLLFLDSVTIGRTVGAATAQPLHVPFAERNVVLDDEAT
ncbi:MAG: divergent polysaccharide deacetylase family protein, partial [Stellaceae bacterium]